MFKRSITQPKDKGLASHLIDLVTGNPIIEDVSPISRNVPAAINLRNRDDLKGGKIRRGLDTRNAKTVAKGII